ncbi:hypothetical protein RHGRI_006774 [Rhododendron griersonianum]|uniref:NB-ARC domain-containing protein n=1 Tax=Rhododendron griersonianum TaxID=479676 RepID=A0AAV6KW06_9ERIC|nr:hypothetical protein RHGRI_006774 [Rhododendron griersonianum]
MDYLVDPIKRQFTYMCCFNTNITELQTQLKELETTRQDVQMGVDENRRKVRVIGRTVEAWLTSANEVTTEVEGIIQDKDKVKEGCLNGWCPNLKLRYSLSRKAVKKTKVVVDLKADGVRYTQTLPSYSPPPACLETITNRDFMGFESRRIIMEDIIKALKHDEINLIGVCGMGGVGKTKMVQEVGKRAKEEKLFDEVAFVALGQNLEITKVQNSIADIFGLKHLKTQDDATTRASLLRRRLSQDNKKILLILDDIWVEFNLEDHGIPLGGSQETLKIIYTSRFRSIWHDVPNKKLIPLENLSKDEAWQLFRDKAGNSADAPDLRPIAKQIVDECGCLPLALVLIGSTLSKKSGGNAIKKIWEDMLDRLTCATSTSVDEHLYSRLKASYEYLEDEEAKRLFLLCCLFKEDEDIRLDDLARYGFGLSLFDGINEMRKARNRVFALVDDLKSSYLLLDGKDLLLGGKDDEFVKVHDVVRDMGLSIATDKFALVGHGAISQWPKTATPEHYTTISVISDQIEELPEGLTYPNLEFLMLRCQKLKRLPPKFLGGMGKLKVLELRGFCGFLTLQSLTNLTTLSLEEFGGTLDNVSVMGDLRNLETLSLRNSGIKEVPKEIGKLIKLRLLDLRGTRSLTRIQPGVIAGLVDLEELYFWDSKYSDWEGEGKEGEVRNANLGEFESLSNLNTLEIYIRSDVIIPKVPIFSKLKIYRVVIADEDYFNRWDFQFLTSKFERMLLVHSSIPIPSDRGGIVYSLLRSSDWLSLEGEGCNDLVRELLLRDMLKKLELSRLPNLREICCGPVPAGSFEELTSIEVYGCERLENLFKLPIEGCLTRQEDVHVATNNIIVFPKLEVLNLRDLPRLVGFCIGIDQIDFPQLKYLSLQQLGGFNRLFHNNCNLSSNSEQNDNVGFLSFFPQKVSLPNLEDLQVEDLENLERLGHGSLSVGSLSKLKEFSVRRCGKLLCVIPSQLLSMLRELQNLTVEYCDSLEVVFEVAELQNLERLGHVPLSVGSFSKLENIFVLDCGKLLSVFPFQLLSMLQELQDLTVDSCNSLEVVFEVAELQNLESLGHVPLSVGSFSKLENMSVYNCNKLLCVFPSQLVPMLRGLQELTVESCDSLEVVFELEGLESNESNPEILSQLKFVKLGNLPKLNCISKRDPVGIKYIQTLEIHNCNSLRYVFAPTMMKSIPQLRELEVSSCEMLSRIVAEENCGMMEEVFWKDQQEDVHAAANRIEFPKLEVLKLENLQSLMGFCRGIDQIDFPQLKELSLQNCGRLRNRFQLPIVGCLPQLIRLIICSCGMMEEVFWKEQQEDVHAAANRIEFPKLEVLKLEKLPSLMHFCRGIDQIDFPQLKQLFLVDLPQVNLFFHNSCNLSSNSKRNDNFGFLSLFPEKRQ